MAAGRRGTRKATKAQAEAMERTMASLAADRERTAALAAGCENGPSLQGEMPDEEKEASVKVDFRVLKHELMEVNLLSEDSLKELSFSQLLAYAEHVGEVAAFYVSEYRCVARQLANAGELILNGRNALFGRSSRRSSALFGEQDGKNRTEAAEEGTVAEESSREEPNEIPGEAKPSGGKEDGSGKTGGKKEDPGRTRPKRTAGCADRVCSGAEKVDIPIRMTEEELDRFFGEGNWEEVPDAETLVKEYTVIPARIIVKIYHLKKYRAKDDIRAEKGEFLTARSPVCRLRRGSRMGSRLMAWIYYYRNTMRIPVYRICSSFRSEGLCLTPQQVYENLQHYDQFFSPFLERLWALLLKGNYIQADETPVRYYCRKDGKVKRGYLWIFTTSEMLEKEKNITLFYFAEGRGAEVLRECLRGFRGILGSDGHAAYQLFARESRGTVENAGCLNHFRDRVVAALRAVPGLAQMTEEEKRKIPAYLIMEKLNAVFALERKVKQLQEKEEREKLRESEVRAAFAELVETTLGMDISGYSQGSYTAGIIRYMENQEVYLEKFLEDGNIAPTNNLCERKFAFFGILRNQIKMFGSFTGAKVAANLESIEQTARKDAGNMRVYYQFLFDKLVPFIKGMKSNNPQTDYASMKELDRFLACGEDFKRYQKENQEKENALNSLALEL